jgi:shikimate kinase
MAVGKSAVGRVLARRLKRRFIDLDKVIEKTQGMKVRKIFAVKGEPFFRELEKQTLAEVLRSGQHVVATGGGAVLDADNLRLLLDETFLVCLTASPDALLKRAGSGSTRPLLNGGERKSQIEKLLQLRAEKYAQAHLMIDTTELTVNQVVERILEMAKLE